MAANKEFKYEEAVRQLEEIVKSMESGEMDVDSLSEQLKTAKSLIRQCKDKLTKTEKEIKKLLDS
ncbi:MAG: exodeoxyribonuclease VII small subunit [Prevotella sp.]